MSYGCSAPREVPAAPSSRAKVESLVSTGCAQHKGWHCSPWHPSCCPSRGCPGTGGAWTWLHPHIWPGCSLATSSRAGQRPAAIQVSHKAKACSWKPGLPHLSPDSSHTRCGSSWSVLGALALLLVPPTGWAGGVVAAVAAQCFRPPVAPTAHSCLVREQETVSALN